MDKTLKVQKIEEGTVIDHIEGGKAWEVIKLLGLDDYPATVTVLSRVNSKSKGKKDIIKIEGSELDKDDLDRVALVSPHASVNVIAGCGIKKKYNVEIPDSVKGILKCTNPNCVTHSEAVLGQFKVESKDPLRLRCIYCERAQNGLEFK